MKRSNNGLRFLYTIMLVVSLIVIINVFLVTLGKVHIRSNTSLNDYVQSVSNVEEKILLPEEISMITKVRSLPKMYRPTILSVFWTKSVFQVLMK